VRRSGFRKSDNAFLAVDDVAATAGRRRQAEPEIIRKRLDYWTLILAKVLRQGTQAAQSLTLLAIAQIEYCRNFIFSGNFPIHKLFERSCELGLWAADRRQDRRDLCMRLNRNMRGKLAPSSIASSTAIMSPRLLQTRLPEAVRKSSPPSCATSCLQHLAEFPSQEGIGPSRCRARALPTITARFAGFQAQWLQCTRRLPAAPAPRPPITIGAVRYPGSKSTTRASSACSSPLARRQSGRRLDAKQIHHAVLTTFHLFERPTA